MTKRLQVLVEDKDMRDLRMVADSHGITVAEWVRQAIRAAREREAGDVSARLVALDRAAAYSFPTGDIDQMLAEIERGRLD